MSGSQDDNETAGEIQSVSHRLDLLRDQVGAIGGIVYGKPVWLSPNYTEPQVLCVLRDLVKTGQTVFDGGANFGDLSVAMSRCVGPRGAVCAFEANPEIARLCQSALVRSGCGNTQLYNTAVYHTSGQKVELYLSDNMVSDSIYRRVSERSIEVLTVALDDFCAQTGLVPQLVKMDIEGAEFDALGGFVATIEEHRPLLILEQQPEDERCLRFLHDRGYAALELHDYRKIGSFADMPAASIVTDVLYAPPHRIHDTPYGGSLERVIEYEIGPEAFQWVSERLYQTSEPIALRRGRYLVTVDFDTAAHVELKCGVSANSIPIMQYHGDAEWLSKSARYWVVPSEERAAAHIFFNFIGAAAADLSVNYARVTRLPAFDDWGPKVFLP